MTSGTGVPPVNHVQDARATIKLTTMHSQRLLMNWYAAKESRI